MSPRQLRVLKRIGYPALGVTAFLTFLYVTFPYERLRQRIQDQVMTSGAAEVSIGNLGPSLLFGLKAKDVVVKVLPKPTLHGLAQPAGEAPPPAALSPQILRFEAVSLNVSLLTLLGLSRSLDIALRFLGGGDIALSLAGSRNREMKLELKAVDVRASSLGQLQRGGPPLGGTLAANVVLQLPRQGLSAADGTISFSCDGCTVGDGKSLLKVPGNPWLAGGITLPRIRLGRVAGDLQLTRGTAQLNKIAAVSPDIKFELSGSVALREPLAFSPLNLKLRLKLEDSLKSKIAALELIEGQLRRFQAPDGFIALPLAGTLGKPQVMGLTGGGGLPRL